jgi:hypothetical protein
MESVPQAKRKTHLSFRFSDEALLVIHLHQEDLSKVKQKPVDRTEALEDIILNFRPQNANSLVNAVKRVFHRRPTADPNTKPLEVFINA